MTQQDQIIERFCTVCGQLIYLDSSVRTKAGHRIPMNRNGSYHDPLHSFINGKAFELRRRREYLESLNTITEEYESREVI